MTALKALAIAVVIVILFILVGSCVVLFSRWLSRKSSWTTRMKFKQWLDLYYLCPKDWCLEDTPNRYVVGKTYGGSYWAYVHFSFPDYLRYQFWKKSAKRRAENTKQDERLKDILELAQSDIARLKQQADQEMEEAKKQVEETSRRVNNPIMCQVTNPITLPPTREFWEALITTYGLDNSQTSKGISQEIDPGF